MKVSKIISSFLAAAALFSLTSCLKDQTDLFPNSSSERLQAYMEQAREILSSAENGWIMEYYPGPSQKLGGYAYHLTFTGSEVTATYELDPEKSCTSLYKLTADNGAVLSFDANNEILHHFATPSSSEYQAKGGDFEFVITSVSPEKIGLRGKRSGNHCDLYPYTSELTPKAYMAKVEEMAGGMRAALLNGKVGETEVNGTVDMNNRRITFNYKESEDGETITVAVPYMYTPTGLKTYEEVEVAGCTMSSFFYYTSNNILSTGSVVFKGSLPKDYTDFEGFAGNYTLSMYNGRITADVTLTANADNSGYLMSGFVPGNHDVKLVYDRAKGRLAMNAQVVGADGSNSVWLAAWGLKGGGNLTWDPEYGMEITRDLKTGKFVFVDNGYDKDLAVDSFILWATDSAGKSQGEFTGWGGDGDNQFPYLQSLTRK